MNIDWKNPENPFKEEIKQLRKNCALMAIKNSEYKNKGKKMILNEATVFGQSTSIIAHIDNITKNDVRNRNIRIKVKNKPLFPLEKTGIPTSYLLDFKTGNTDFKAEYKIGSKDGKSRSGILKLGDNIYDESLKIRAGTALKISKAKENKYLIERI